MARSILMLIFTTCLHLFGQQYFHLNSALDTVIVELNGTIYQVGASGNRLSTNYPGFDTVRLKRDYWTSPFLCNFKPDSSYTLFPACCASMDIIPAWKARVDSLKIWDYELDFDKIQQLLMDKPVITLKIIHGTRKDRIYGWYADYACFPRFKLITRRGWKYGTPFKCFYWSNLSHFVFFTSKHNYQKSTHTSGVVEDVYPEDVEELGAITVRLFDHQKFSIIYDVKLKNIRVQYD
jgi:hypothetical protein